MAGKERGRWPTQGRLSAFVNAQRADLWEGTFWALLSLEGAGTQQWQCVAKGKKVNGMFWFCGYCLIEAKLQLPGNPRQQNTDPSAALLARRALHPRPLLGALTLLSSIRHNGHPEDTAGSTSAPNNSHRATGLNHQRKGTIPVSMVYGQRRQPRALVSHLNLASETELLF